MSFLKAIISLIRWFFGHLVRLTEPQRIAMLIDRAVELPPHQDCSSGMREEVDEGARPRKKPKQEQRS
eukprot:gene25365-30629_t